jgi:hypothetical protein
MSLKRSIILLAAVTAIVAIAVFAFYFYKHMHAFAVEDPDT